MYRPRRPSASPLYRLLSDHFDRFRGRYEEEFERQQGRWRSVVDGVVTRFLECGVLEAGFARVRCDAWAELIRLIYEVDPLVCPRCGGAMRVLALIQEPAVIDKILRYLRSKGRDARAGPWATGPPGAGVDADAA